MKRLILFLGLMAAASVNASYLYWQVSDEAYGAGVSGGTYNAARLVAYLTANPNERVYLNSVRTDVDGATAQQYMVLNEFAHEVTAYVNLDQLTNAGESLDASLYSYYIELGTYAASTFVADNAASSLSGNMTTYDQLADAGHIVTELSPIALQNAWAGGSYAVPEPTSGLLMMLGFALVGLRRRKV